MKRAVAIGGLVLLGALSACGKVGPLEPTPNIAPPAKAMGQSEVPDTDSLLEPSIQTRPGRSDELMRRSERRTDDPFDLPPGSDPAKPPVPPPAESKPAKPK
jgi:predicted small lipoprotein YifL